MRLPCYIVYNIYSFTPPGHVQYFRTQFTSEQGNLLYVLYGNDLFVFHLSDDPRSVCPVQSTVQAFLLRLRGRPPNIYIITYKPKCLCAFSGRARATRRCQYHASLCTAQGAPGSTSTNQRHSAVQLQQHARYNTALGLANSSTGTGYNVVLYLHLYGGLGQIALCHQRIIINYN